MTVGKAQYMKNLRAYQYPCSGGLCSYNNGRDLLDQDTNMQRLWSSSGSVRIVRRRTLSRLDDAERLRGKRPAIQKAPGPTCAGTASSIRRSA